MTDYGREVRFGVFPSPETARGRPRRSAIAEIADDGGLDLVGIQDHPYQARVPGHLVADGRRARAYLAGARVSRRGQPAAALAGRAGQGGGEPGCDLRAGGSSSAWGAGAFGPAIAAMGGPSEPARAGEALAEAIDVIRLMWSGQRTVSYEGQHYRLSGLHPGPSPLPIGIWLGVGGPKMLALTGRAADGWVPSSSDFPPEALPGMHARIDEAAVTAGLRPGRDPADYNVMGTISDGASRGPFDGPADQWAETLTGLALGGGMDTFVFAPPDDELAQVRRFAEQVAPAVRDQVARQRRER